MGTRTVGFAIAEEDEARLERLTAKFGNGNRSAFLLEAMRQMEVIDRAARLAALVGYGAGLVTSEAALRRQRGRAAAERDRATVGNSRRAGTAAGVAPDESRC